MTQNRWFFKNALQELVKSTQAQILTLQTEPRYDFFILVVLLLPPVVFLFFFLRACHAIMVMDVTTLSTMC